MLLGTAVSLLSSQALLCSYNVATLTAMIQKTNKSTMMRARCTPNELASWERAAEELGVSLSTWVRTWLNHGCERDVRGRLVHK